MYQHRVEPFVAGRHRCMGSKDRGRPDILRRLGEAEMLLLHQTADALQCQKPGMSLVEMISVDLETHGSKRSHAANTQDNLLPDARVFVAAV